MKKRIYILLATASAMLLSVGCGKEPAEMPNDSFQPRAIEVTTDVATRAGVETGNLMSFSMITADYTEPFTVSRTAADQPWKTGGTYYWKTQQSTIIEAWANATRTAADNYSYEVKTDQSTEANLVASDFVLDYRLITPTANYNGGDLVDGKLPITLNHKNAKIKVNVTYDSTLGEKTNLISNQTITIGGVKVAATCLIQQQGAGQIFNTLGNATNVTALRTSAAPTVENPTDTFEAIIVPQNSNATVTLSLQYAGKTIHTNALTLPNSPINFNSGNEYTVNLTARYTQTELELKIDPSGITVGDWTSESLSNGTAQKTWEKSTINLNTVDKFWEFVKRVNAGKNFVGQTIVLGQDINVSQKPAAYSSTSLPLRSFSGTFNGNGKTISNLSGLRGFCNTLNPGGTIQSLSINGSITATDNNVGALVCNNQGTITSCSSSCTVTQSGNRNYIGGLVGISSGTIADCSVSGSVTGYQYVGGVVGNNSGRVYSINCTANVYAGTTEAYAGGIAGRNSGTYQSSTNAVNGIVFCTFNGNVCNTNSGRQRIGGIVGYNEGQVDGCSVNGGTIGYNNSNTYYVGGIVGYNYDSSSNNIKNARITLCAVKEGVNVVAANSASGSNYGYAGGIVGYMYNGYVVGCYSAATVSGETYDRTQYFGGIVGSRGNGTVMYCRFKRNLGPNYVVGNTKQDPNYTGSFTYYGSTNSNQYLSYYIPYMNSEAQNDLYRSQYKFVVNTTNPPTISPK